GLVYADWAAGKSVIVALPKDSIGQLPGGDQPNVIVYPDALGGVVCDIRYTIRAGSFEQDVVLLKRPETPEAFGLSSKSSRLQVWTEFVEAPAPVTQTKLVPQSIADPFAVEA